MKTHGDLVVSFRAVALPGILSIVLRAALPALPALLSLAACSGGEAPVERSPDEARPQDASQSPPGTPASSEGGGRTRATPKPQYFLTSDQTHNRFSRTIPPVLSVPSGAVIEVRTEEASDRQITPESTAEALATLDFDPIHPLTGPVFVEGAEPGDVLAVTLHEIEVGDWGWVAVVPGFGFLAEDFPTPYLKT